MKKIVLIIIVILFLIAGLFVRYHERIMIWNDYNLQFDNKISLFDFNIDYIMDLKKSSSPNSDIAYGVKLTFRKNCSQIRSREATESKYSFPVDSIKIIPWFYDSLDSKRGFFIQNFDDMGAKGACAFIDTTSCAIYLEIRDL